MTVTHIRERGRIPAIDARVTKRRQVRRERRHRRRRVIREIHPAQEPFVARDQLLIQLFAQPTVQRLPQRQVKRMTKTAPRRRACRSTTPVCAPESVA